MHGSIGELAETSGASFTPGESSLNDKNPVTCDAFHRELSSFVQSSVERAGPIFSALGASRVTRPDGSTPGVQISGGTGRVVFAIEPGTMDSGTDGSERVPGGRTLGGKIPPPAPADGAALAFLDGSPCFR